MKMTAALALLAAAAIITPIAATAIDYDWIIQIADRMGINIPYADLTGVNIGPYADLSGADLSGADLTGVNLFGADLTRANLTGTNLAGADLTGANLNRADLIFVSLSGADLSGADFTDADLIFVTLSGADLSGADFTDADFDEVFFSGADLSGADLSSAYLTAADFRSADLTGADLSGADLATALFTGADLTGADLTGADLSFVSLAGADLAGVYLADADLFGANFDRANLAGADLSGADLPDIYLGRANLAGADLSGANLVGVYLAGANLVGADLTGADLTDADIGGTFFPGADLTGADLTDAILRNADLTGADLTDAILRNADLTGADLTDAILRNADLTGADLTGADLTGADLTGADLTGAEMPDTDTSDTDTSDTDTSDTDTSDTDLPGAGLQLEPEDGETLAGSVALGDLDTDVPASIFLIDPDGDPVASGIMSITLTPDTFVPDATLDLEISPDPIGDVPGLPSAPYLFFDVNLPDTNFSDPANFSETGLPRIKFTVPTTSDIPEMLADGCPASSVFLFDDGDWAQLGHPLIGGNQIYVTNMLNNSVSIVDIANNEVVKRVKVGTDPDGAAFNAQTGLLYVSNTGSDSVTVVDVARHVTTTIEVGALPSGVVVDERNNMAYVVQATGGITVINGSSNEVTGSISVPGASLDGIAFDFAGMRGYVGDFDNGIISVINLTTNTIIGEIDVGGGPAAIDIDPDAGIVYSSIPSLGAVVAINAATGAVMHTIPVGGSPSGLVFNPNGDRVYVGDTLSNAVQVIDARTHTVAREIPIGQAPHGMDVIQSTNTLYVTSQESGDIVAIDGDTDVMLGSIKADAGSRAIAVNPSVSNPVRVPFADTIYEDGAVECSYAAGLPHLSKFAIGGIKPASAPGEDTAADAAPPAFDPMGSEHVNINGDAFHIEHFEARTGTQTFGVGDSITMTFAVLEQGGADDLVHFEFLTNLTGPTRDYDSGDTRLQYDASGVRVIDPNGYFSSSFVGVSDDGADLVHITVELTFAKPMASSDVILRMWDEQRHSLAATIPDMIEIVE